MRSCLYFGHVWHRRRRPRTHEFTYPVGVFCLALDELPMLAARLRLWSWNGRNLFALFDRDHVDGREGALDAKIRQFLAARDVCIDGASILLITQCRVFGYAFNPVSFFLCVNERGELVAAVAEVNSTFGERHLYLLEERHRSTRPVRRYVARKVMHVSPFLSMDAEYDFRIAPLGERLSVTILERERGTPVLDARLSGRRAALTDRQLLWLAGRYPLETAKITAAIHWEALRLWFKKVPVHRRPPPSADQLAQRAELQERSVPVDPHMGGAR